MNHKPSARKKITIIHVQNGLPFGGNENLCLQILRHPPTDVHNILLNLNPEKTDMLSVFQQLPDLSIIDCRYLRDQRVKFVWKLIQIFNQFRPQAILVYCFGMHVLIGLAGRLVGVPLIVVHAGNPVPNEPMMRSKWEKIVIASRLLQIPIHSCSEYVHNTFQSLAQLPENSFPITNGCDIEAITQRVNLSRKDRTNRPKIVIGMVARLNSIKDHSTLITAFGVLRQGLSDVELWLIGDGEEKENLQNLTHKLGLDSTVIFFGNRSDIPELLGQMDICAFSTTNNEGFGIALIEAMAAGLPIVASDVAACREVLGNGKAGLLVCPQNSPALALVLGNLAISPQDRNEWGQKAYQHAKTNHSIQKCTKEWFEVLLSK